MQNGQKHEPSERIIIPKSEFRLDSGWKVLDSGLLESPDGRTEFDDLDQDGNVVGTHSYYLDTTATVVKSVFKP